MSWASRWTRRTARTELIALGGLGAGADRERGIMFWYRQTKKQQTSVTSRLKPASSAPELLARLVLIASVPVRSQNCFQKRAPFVLEVEAAPAFAAAVTTLRCNAVNHVLSTGRSSSPARRDERKVSPASGEVSGDDANCAGRGGRSSARR